ncbi:hypothetical protein [Pseudobacillus wudalianchiensis]|uniref:Uncharacterized protein n=1 Tax=Pseudobacillus wudalianchiensis TaxID=1743143 RepID=A0A1B9ATX1_9BACI|nr:hypothetical protein [Bacillus wudalianchiensis]OCA87313.1 hypothetical protein A8F95_08695 [Bacillus wudalianchiensis]
MRDKQRSFSPVATVIREAAGSGNQFAKYLIQSRDYFAEKNEKHRRERVVISLQQRLKYTKHSKCQRKIQRQLQELGEAK